jgi:hypothetical protein
MKRNSILRIHLAKSPAAPHLIVKKMVMKKIKVKMSHL